MEQPSLQKNDSYTHLCSLFYIVVPFNASSVAMITSFHLLFDLILYVFKSS